MQQISTHQLADWLGKCAAADALVRKPVLLDVREPWEHEFCLIGGSLRLPMNLLPSRLHELDGEADVVVICHHGVRSVQVATFLERNGFGSIYNLAGGIDAWAHDVDQAMRKY